MSSRHVHNAFLLECLEPRLLLSGNVVDIVPHAGSGGGSETNGAIEIAVKPGSRPVFGEQHAFGESIAETPRALFSHLEDLDFLDSESTEGDQNTSTPAANSSGETGFAKKALKSLPSEELEAQADSEPQLLSGTLDLSNTEGDLTFLVHCSGQVDVGTGPSTIQEDGSLALAKRDTLLTTEFAQTLKGGKGTNTYMFEKDADRSMTVDGGAGQDKLVVLGSDRRAAGRFFGPGHGFGTDQLPLDAEWSDFGGPDQCQFGPFRRAERSVHCFRA